MFRFKMIIYRGGYPTIASRISRKFSNVPKNALMKDIKVLELCSVLAGPSAGQYFAELGASVIKVENMLTTGDVTRSWLIKGEKTDNKLISSYFSCCNAGKKSLVLDLSKKIGKSIVHDLIKTTDIVIVSYKPGDAEKLSVDYETLSKFNSLLIYGQITGYGNDDKRVGYDAVIQGESGFQMINGQKESDPTKMPVALVDVLTAHQLKEGILCALYKREKLKIGSKIEVSLFESAVSALVNQATGYLIAGKVPSRIGSIHPSIAPYGDLYSTKDGYQLIVAVGTNKQFTNLCEILGDANLAKNKNYSSNELRVINRNELDGSLKVLFKKMNKNDILRKCHEQHVPVGAINDMKQVFELNLAKNIIIKDDKNKVNVGLKQNVCHSLGVSDISPPPGYGEHTCEILKSQLNIPDDILNMYIKEKIVYQL